MDKYKFTTGQQLNKTREILVYFQAPRYTTTDRDLLKTPRQGQIVFNITTNKLNVYNGSSWEQITSS
jgi:hypothetical protein